MDSMENTEAPIELRKLLEKLNFRTSPGDPHKGTLFQLPQLHSMGTALHNAGVEEVVVTSSVMIPVRDDPYVVEISVSQSWRGLQTASPPSKSWQIEFYGIQWDEILNYPSGSDRQKAWGEDLSKIWPGSSHGLEGGLRVFLHKVLDVHAALDACNVGSEVATNP